MGSNFHITYTREYIVPGLNDVHHMSFYRAGTLFASDKEGNIVQTDQQGNGLWTLPTSEAIGWDWHGFHTVTQNGDLLYIDRSTNNNIINRMTAVGVTSIFSNTGGWKPLSIYASNTNGDILVGMKMGREAKISRYTNCGREKQIIVMNDNNEDLFSFPSYITENAMGYICVSDYILNTVVVVNKRGKHMFSYKYLDQPRYKPFGICTYQSNAIFVCYTRSENIHLMTHCYNQIRTTATHDMPAFQQQVNHPRALCWENANTLHVGQSDTNTVKVYTVHRQ